ncbi:hypothetical protein KM043_008228 [Ampulex compressa]|nr:hypothetical protein KM043_008228 [Ampulex compressa]
MLLDVCSYSRNRGECEPNFPDCRDSPLPRVVVRPVEGVAEEPAGLARSTCGTKVARHRQCGSRRNAAQAIAPGTAGKSKGSSVSGEESRGLASIISVAIPNDHEIGGCGSYLPWRSGVYNKSECADGANWNVGVKYLRLAGSVRIFPCIAVILLVVSPRFNTITFRSDSSRGEAAISPRNNEINGLPREESPANSGANMQGPFHPASPGSIIAAEDLTRPRGEIMVPFLCARDYIGAGGWKQPREMPKQRVRSLFRVLTLLRRFWHTRSCIITALACAAYIRPRIYQSQPAYAPAQGYERHDAREHDGDARPVSWELFLDKISAPHGAAGRPRCRPGRASSPHRTLSSTPSPPASMEPIATSCWEMPRYRRYILSSIAPMDSAS